MLSKPLSDLTGNLFKFTTVKSLIIRIIIHLLLGCKIFNSAWNLNDFSEEFCGFLTSLTVKKINNKSYVHFENKKAVSVIQTMCFYVQNESFTPEIQVR
jgi:hypothetical protein